MESDDDYQISSHPEEPSSPIHQRKLKRLKKSVSNGSTSQSTDQAQSMNVFGSPHDADQVPTETIGNGNLADSVQAVLGSEGFDGERDSSSKQDEFPVDRDSLEDEGMVNVEEEDSFDDLDAATEEFEFKGDGLIDMLRAEFGHSKTEKAKEKRRSSEEGEVPCDADLESSKPPNIKNLVDCEGDLTTKEDGFDSLWDERNVEEEGSFGDLDEAAEEFDVNKGGLINELRSEIGISKKKKRTKTKKKTHSSEVGGEEEHKQSKKKRGKRERPEALAISKRRLEKERKIHLEQLHVESQRLLRETSGVAFKPVPLVKKPISSVLEKIRQRKLEVLKLASSLSNYDDSDDSFGGTMLEHPEHYPKNDKSDHEEGDDKHPKEVDRDVHTVDEEGSHLDAAHDQSHCDPASLSHENILPNMAVDVEEVSKNAFLAQSDDTQQNVLRGPQPSNEESGKLEGQVDNPMNMQLEDLVDSPMEEAMAPSLLTMNLKLDPTSPYDISSSDEEDNEKENNVPHPQILVNRELCPKGDPVKAFVDDEAEEEDDSDNDLMRFKDDEEDDENEASEEFNDLIVTGFKEKPIDNEKRDQLHQMWLEKQDAAATDNVLQRLKCGRKHKETPFLEEDEEDEEDEDDKEDEESGDDSADETLDHLHQKNFARINSKKAKEMMPQLFTDKDDSFLSSDDEETEQKLVRQRLAEKAEEHGSFLSPADDESSREVFGLIKKLNVAPDTKKKAKPSSIFDMLISGGNSNCSSKSSFLGRATSSSSLPTSRKHGSSTSRSYIFGRDDSNSRCEVSTSEVSIDMVVEKDSRTIATTTTTRTSSASAKFISSCSSQSSKCSTQNNSSRSSSLLEILRRSTEKSNNKNSFTPEKNNMVVGQKTQSVAQFFSAFKPGAGKKSSIIKIERRST